MVVTSVIFAETSPYHDFVRQRTEGFTASKIKRTRPDLFLNDKPVLERIGHEEAIELGLPPLDFRPAILQNSIIWLSILFNFTILGILVFLYIKQDISISYAWAYFVVKLLPTTLGTITLEHLASTVTALNRVTPFMLCAHREMQHDSAPAGKTILLSYYPRLSYRDLAKSRNWLLISGEVLLFTAPYILSLKSTFLLTEDYMSAYVVRWALQTLIAFYSLFCVFLFAIFWHLKGRITGLRWDPVSIADQLVLFRHSDFLERFSGTCIASRKSLNRSVGEHTRLRLGYWKMGSTYWHGFGLAKDDQYDEKYRKVSRGNGANEEVTLKASEISSRRYRSASSTVLPWLLWPFNLFILSLLGGALVFMIMGPKQKFQFELPFSTDVAVFVFSFALSFVIGFVVDFCESLSFFMAETEPFVHLAKVDDEPGAGFGNASETLLLDYHSLALPMVLYTSFVNGHWKVFWAKVLARLQHIFIIIFSGSCIIYYGGGGGAILEISLPFFIIMFIWLFVCLIWIPALAVRCEDSRFLPRTFCSPADLLSWAHESSILRGDLPASSEYGYHYSDPLDIQFVPNYHHSPPHLSLSEQGTLDQTIDTSKPDNELLIKRTAYDRNHLKARLTLTNTKFCFGLNRLKKSNMYTVGICDRLTFENTLSRPNWRCKLGNLWSTTKRRNVAPDEWNDPEYIIEGWYKFKKKSTYARSQESDSMLPLLMVPSEDRYYHSH